MASPRLTLRASLLLALSAALFAACDPAPGAGPDDAGVDTGPTVVSIDHCSFEPMTLTARAGGTVSEGTLYAGTAERFISIPIGVTLGAYTARSEGFGNEGFVDDRRSALGGGFASSVGIETWPRVRVLALATGRDTPDEADDETVLIIKADLGVAWQGVTHALEARLGPEYAGKVLFAVSHTHSGFANYTGHSAMQVGFGQFRSSAYEPLMDDLEAAAREAIEDLAPASIGFAYDGAFDEDDEVNRDRRGENDMLAGGSFDDHHLYVIRVDRLADPAPIPLAIIPVFGMHGTIHGADNVLVSTDSTGGLERVIEEQFDHEVLVMHLQGAAGDVSPAGRDTTDCGERTLCSDYARPETIGWAALDEIMAAWTEAGTSMTTSIEAEMVSRSVPRGFDAARFTVRDGELEYAPFDLRRQADGVVWNPDGTLASPIDEFNAPFGAALCGSDLFLSYAVMPGTRELTDTPYPTCLMLQSVERVFEAALDIDLETPPMCDTLRTTVSALRLGDHLFMTLPGEPATLLADRMRSLSPMDVQHTIVVGYAQDHGGYMLTAEDWLQGGYEPNITFWGPLEGEAIMESAVALAPLVMTPEREEATAGGADRVTPPMIDDGFVSDAAPRAGEVPDPLPTYLLTRESPSMPSSAQPPGTVARLENVIFTWIGEDPLEGTPRVSVEHETAPDVWEPLVRRSGRPVADGDFILTHTPDPLNSRPDTPRVHYWSVEWQAVAALGQVGLERVEDRVGLPLGRYRFVVEGPSYTVASRAFEVSAASIGVEGSATASAATLTLRFHAPDGFRLLDVEVGASRPVPVRGGMVSAAITYAGGGSETLLDLAVGADGSLSVPLTGTATSIVITDRFGNAGTFTP